MFQTQTTITSSTDPVIARPLESRPVLITDISVTADEPTVVEIMDHATNIIARFATPSNHSFVTGLKVRAACPIIVRSVDAVDSVYVTMTGRLA